MIEPGGGIEGELLVSAGEERPRWRLRLGFSATVLIALYLMAALAPRRSPERGRGSSVVASSSPSIPPPGSITARPRGA